jgi:hypothetical protein
MRVTKQRLATLRRKGRITVRIKLSQAGRVTLGTALVRAGHASRLVPGRRATFAGATTRTLHVKLDRKARRRLAGYRRVTLRFSAAAFAAGRLEAHAVKRVVLR